MKKHLVLLTVLLAFVSCKKEQTSSSDHKEENKSELLTKASAYFQPISSVENTNLDPEKVALGKYLYFDTNLSKDGNISCNSCHNLNTYGVDNLAFSPGDDGSLGGVIHLLFFMQLYIVCNFGMGEQKMLKSRLEGLF